MRDLGPVHETDRLLDALGSRQAGGDGQDEVVSMLAAWAREIDPTPGGGLPAVGAGAPRRRGRHRRRVAAGTLLVALTMSGTSIAAALTGTHLPVLTPMGEALVGVVPGGADLLALGDDRSADARDEAGVPARGDRPEQGEEPLVGETPVDRAPVSVTVPPHSPGLSSDGGVDLGSRVHQPAAPAPGDGSDDGAEEAVAPETTPVEPVVRPAPRPFQPGPAPHEPAPVRPGPPVDRPGPPPGRPGPPPGRPWTGPTRHRATLVHLVGSRASPALRRTSRAPARQARPPAGQARPAWAPGSAGPPRPGARGPWPAPGPSGSLAQGPRAPAGAARTGT